MAFILIAQVTVAQDEALKKDILRIIELNGTTNQMKSAKSQILPMIPAEKHAAFLIEFDAAMPALYEKLVKVYMDTYTKEDIKAMTVFYNSPVGKKIAQTQDQLSEKSQEATKEWGQGLQAMVMKYMN